MRKIFHLTTFILFIALFSCKSSIVDDPALTIRYSVPEKSVVKLTIENSYNTIILTPINNDEKNAGDYVVSIALNDFAEGVYFYTVELKGINSSYYSKITKPLLVVK